MKAKFINLKESTASMRRLILLALYLGTALSEIEVTGTEGKVQGRLFEEEDVIAYLGIPYAQSPTGDLRLEDARKLDARTETYKAVEWPSKCFVFKRNENVLSKSEDCLYLSLLLPRTPAKSKPPLLVIFSNADLDEKLLLKYVGKSNGIALVHSRQGPLGFFADTNPGFSDVQAAISWLNANKNNFGFGDLTLLAENDDASLVAYAVAEKKETSFARAILLNGNTAVRRFQPKYRRVRATLRLLKLLNCTFDKTDEIKSFLKTVQISKLHSASRNLRLSDASGAPFRPKKFEGDRLYPVIIGAQSSLHEDYLTDDDFDVTYSRARFDRFMRELISDKEYRNAALLRRIAFHLYADSEADASDTYLLWRATRKMLLDRDFLVPIRNLVFSLSPEKNPVYFLEYAVKNPIATCLTPYVSEVSSGFCDRIWFYFVHFATHGEPAEGKCDLEDPSWPRLKSIKRDYHLTVNASGSVEWNFNFHQAAFAFWNNLAADIERDFDVKVKTKENAEANEEKMRDEL